MKDFAKQAVEAIFGSFVAVGALVAAYLLLGMGNSLLVFKNQEEEVIFLSLCVALISFELGLFSWRIEESSPHGPSPERKVLVIGWVTILSATTFIAKDSTLFITDPEGFLNILIEISGLMMGFASVVWVFLIQYSIQNEKDAASDYVRLLVEAHRVKSEEKPGHAAYLERVHFLMKAYKTRGEWERHIRKDLLLFLTLTIVPFIASVFASIYTMGGQWFMIWLPLSLVLVGSLSYVWIIGLFLLFSYPWKGRAEFSVGQE